MYTYLCICPYIYVHVNTFHRHIPTHQHVYLNVCVLEKSISPHQSNRFIEQSKDRAEADSILSLTVSHITMYTSVLNELLTC